MRKPKYSSMKLKGEFKERSSLISTEVAMESNERFCLIMPRTHGANKSILFAQIFEPYLVNLSGFAQIKHVLFAHVYKALALRLLWSQMNDFALLALRLLWKWEERSCLISTEAPEVNCLPLNHVIVGSSPCRAPLKSPLLTSQLILLSYSR